MSDCVPTERPEVHIGNNIPVNDKIDGDLVNI